MFMDMLMSIGTFIQVTNQCQVYLYKRIIWDELLEALSFHDYRLNFLVP